MIAVLVLVPMLVSAQTYTVYNTDNSDLPANSVYGISFDQQNNIWFGGQRDAGTGLAYVSMLSWDLSTWTVYDYKDPNLSLDIVDADRVYYIAADDRNTKYFCTHYGVSYLMSDGTTGVVDFTNGAYDRSVYTDRYGNIFISLRDSDRSLSKIYKSDDHGTTWTGWDWQNIGFTMGSDAVRPEMYDLRYDSMGRMWICTWYGVTRQNLDGTWTFITETEGEYTHAMAKNWNDHMWASKVDYNNNPVGPTVLLDIAPDGTIIEVDGTTISELYDFAVTDMEFDCNGDLWCATDGAGILQIHSDLTYEKYTNASTNGQLPQDIAYHLEIRENEIWVATQDSGVVRIDGLIDVGDPMVFTSDNTDLPYNSMYNISFDEQNNVWFSGQRDAATGVANVSKLSWDLSTWTIFPSKSAELGLDIVDTDRVYYIAADDRNTKYFCTHYGVSYMMNDGTAGVVDFTNGAYDRSVFTDQYGNAYISLRDSDRTLSKIYKTTDNGATWTGWNTTDIGFILGPDAVRPEVYDLRHDSKGRLWVCTWYGVTRMNLDGSWTLIADLEGDYTHAMAKNWDDHMWVSYVEYADGGAAAPTELIDIAPDGTISIVDGSVIPLLTDYAVTDMEFDMMGHLWCTTNGGGILEVMSDLTYNIYTVDNTGGVLPQDIFHHLEYKCGALWLASQDNGVLRIAPGDLNNNTGVVEEREAVQPSAFTLHVNYPNPFNPSTRITFDVKEKSDIHLAVYDLRGNLVSSLAQGQYGAGTYHLNWDGRDAAGRTMPSGVYLYRLKTGAEVFSRKMMLLK